jgi:hypothetical protein
MKSFIFPSLCHKLSDADLQLLALSKDKDSNQQSTESYVDIITLSIGILINAAEINSDVRLHLLQYVPPRSSIFPQYLAELFAMTTCQLQIFDLPINTSPNTKHPDPKNNNEAAIICCRMLHSYIVLLIALLADHDMASFLTMRTAFRTQNENNTLTITTLQRNISMPLSTPANDTATTIMRKPSNSNSASQPPLELDFHDSEINNSTSSSSSPSVPIITMRGLLRSLTEFVFVQSEMDPDDSSLDSLFILIEKLKSQIQQIEQDLVL